MDKKYCAIVDAYSTTRASEVLSLRHCERGSFLRHCEEGTLAMTEKSQNNYTHNLSLQSHTIYVKPLIFFQD